MEDHSDWFGAETATFGDRVAGAREALGLSQPELAKKIGIKVKTLRDWENDLSEPRANKLQMLSGILGVSLMWLLNGEGDGLDGPANEEGTAPEFTKLLTELRSVQTELDRGAERLAKLEKQLRTVMREQGAI